MSFLYNIQSKGFDLFIILSYLSYALVLLGVTTSAPQYLSYIDYYVKIYISLFLLWRFNMFQKIQFSELDRRIAFSAGMFLLTTTAATQITQDYLEEIRGVMSMIFQTFIFA